MDGLQMRAEMAEQPRVLADLAARRASIVASIRAAVPDDLAGIVLIGRGSSDNAAIFARYAFEIARGRPVALAAPSLHTLYGARSDYRGYLAIAVSQSGRTPEIVSVLEAAARAGATTVAIPAEALGAPPWGDADWDRLPGVVGEVVAHDAPADACAAAIGDAPGLITVARGFLFPVALEAALKLKEAALLLAEGYSAADLLHGPVAVVEHGFPVLAFVADGPARASMEDLVRDLRGRGARTSVVGPAGADLPVPGGLAEGLATIPAAVRAQQVARSLALVRGLDPDAPRGLSKVTMTR
ncbi:MAG: SIS domain-containing protein [Actinomycetota bacterium]